MAGERIQLDLFIPEAVWASVPNSKKIALRDLIREAQALSVKLNEGSPNEEATDRAVHQTCRHDEDGQCDPWVEI